MNIKDLLHDEILALTIYGEARGESIEGQVAVANVILNRTKNDVTKISTICLAPKQFSCWNTGDPNFEKLTKFAESMILGKTITDKYYRQCHYVALGIITQKLLDNTGGAVNYMTTELFNSPKRPKWAAIPKTNPKVIDSHTFFSV